MAVLVVGVVAPQLGAAGGGEHRLGGSSEGLLKALQHSLQALPGPGGPARAVEPDQFLLQLSRGKAVREQLFHLYPVPFPRFFCSETVYIILVTFSIQICPAGSPLSEMPNFLLNFLQIRQKLSS